MVTVIPFYDNSTIQKPELKNDHYCIFVLPIKSYRTYKYIDGKDLEWLIFY